jgi:hypothetical protein
VAALVGHTLSVRHRAPDDNRAKAHGACGKLRRVRRSAPDDPEPGR